MTTQVPEPGDAASPGPNNPQKTSIPEHHSPQSGQSNVLKKSIQFNRVVAWKALGMISWTVIFLLVLGYLYAGTRVVVFLQPVLLPLAFAGVISYLLNPVVDFLQKKFRFLGRMGSVSVVMVAAFAIFAGIFASAIPPIIEQGNELIDNRESIIRSGMRTLDNTIKNPAVKSLIDRAYEKAIETSKAENIPLSSSETSQPLPATPPGNDDPHRAEVSGTQKLVRIIEVNSGSLIRTLLNWFGSTGEVFFGILGYTVGFVLVPIFTFYFLVNSQSIREQWPKLLPMRNSRVKDEVVETLNEINQYLVAFFRGQMLVSIIDGVLTGLFLHFLLDLPYAFVIGATLALLGIVPYVGFVVVLVPTLAIAWFQWGDASHLLYVAAIFFGVNQLDSWIIQPKIVGDSVGLHPMTVIFSVLFWSFLLGGLLGSLLAVPLTAALKVLFGRYIWQNLGKARQDSALDTVATPTS